MFYVVCLCKKKKKKEYWLMYIYCILLTFKLATKDHIGWALICMNVQQFQHDENILSDISTNYDSVHPVLPYNLWYSTVFRSVLV